MRNALYWIGVIPEDPRVSERFKYGDFSWMQYSKSTWEYWCKVHGVEFIHYDRPTKSDLLAYKVNWQRWIDIPKYIDDDFDAFMLVDASTMVRWDAPNYFELTRPGCIGVTRTDENWKWVYESAAGYAHLFPEVQFNPIDYISSGMMLFRREHIEFLTEFSQFYIDNHAELLELEDTLVRRGRDQPVMNYFIQKHGLECDFWPLKYAVSHLYRRDVLGHNWQLQDMTPHFIKYFYMWAFSGFPDRGESRTTLMKSTWDLIAKYYK